LTYDGNVYATVDRLINSGRLTDHDTSAFEPRTPVAPRSGDLSVDSRFAALLSRLVAAAPMTGTRCIQFIACGGERRAGSVAFSVAQAAAVILGRTLVLDARLDLAPSSMPASNAQGPVPDAFLPQLYHHRLAQRPGDMTLMFGGARLAALNALIAPFRFVAVDCPPPALGPATSAMAPLCLGSVLVVGAGAGTREAVREAALQVTSAGGKILGTVLDQAPGDLPAWVTGGSVQPF
jgi:hypothetical protein